MNGHINALSRRTFVGTAAAVGIGAAATLAFHPTLAQAVTAAEKQAEASAALDQLNAMQDKLDIASADYYTALDAQNAAQEKMDECQRRIDETNEQISALQEQLGTRARSMYRSGALSFLDLLLGATTFQAFTTNWDLLNSMNENDANMVQQTKDLKAEVEAQKDEYAAQEAEYEKQVAQAQQVKDEAEELVNQMQATYDSLSAEAAELLRQEEEAREAAEAAAAAAAEEEARRKAQAEAAAKAAAAAQNNSSSSGSDLSSSSSSNVNNDKVQTVTGNVVVDRAYSQLGKPYAWGATGPDSFDCSGLVSYCLTGSYGVRLGTTYTFMGWTQVTDPQPGDVCTSWSHCGIYIGGGQMIHAPRTGDVVKVAGVQSGMIYVRY